MIGYLCCCHRNVDIFLCEWPEYCLPKNFLGVIAACSDSGIDDEDEFATKFIYNNGNNASTDNITAWVAA